MISKNRRKLLEINHILEQSDESNPYKMNYTSTKTKEYKSLNSDKVDESIKMQRVIKKKDRKNNTVNNFFDQIYVINMEEDYHKLEQTKKVLDKLNIKFKVIKGINVNDTNNDYVNRWLYQKNGETLLYRNNFNYKSYVKLNPQLKFDNEVQAWNHYVNMGSKKGYRVYPKSEIVNSAQLGCLLSHVSVLNDALENKYEKIMILEDDNYYHKNFNNIIPKYLNNKWDLLYLGAIQKKWTNMSNLYRAKYTKGSFAYALNYNLFNIIKKIAMSFTLPYDKCLQKLHENYKCYVIYPNLVITDLEHSKIQKKKNIHKYKKLYRWDLNNYLNM